MTNLPSALAGATTELLCIPCQTGTYSAAAGGSLISELCSALRFEPVFQHRKAFLRLLDPFTSILLRYFSICFIWVLNQGFDFIKFICVLFWNRMCSFVLCRLVTELFILGLFKVLLAGNFIDKFRRDRQSSCPTPGSVTLTR